MGRNQSLPKFAVFALDSSHFSSPTFEVCSRVNTIFLCGSFGEPPLQPTFQCNGRLMLPCSVRYIVHTTRCVVLKLVWLHSYVVGSMAYPFRQVIVTTLDSLQIPREFAENDRSSDKPFLNIFDKGYQCSLQALMEGQECMQPTFAQSDKQFTDRATLYSAVCSRSSC